MAAPGPHGDAEDLWDLVHLYYPYPGSTNITPIAAFFVLAEGTWTQDWDRNPPPPAVAMLTHALVRPEVVRFTDEPVHCAAFDGHPIVERLLHLHEHELSTLLDLQADDAKLAESDDDDDDFHSQGPTTHRSFTSRRLVNVAHMAALGGQTALLRVIRQIEPRLTTQPDDCNRQVIHFAAMARLPLDALNELHDEMTEEEAHPAHPTDTHGLKPIHFAARWGTLDGVRVCLARRDSYCQGTLLHELRSRFDETPFHFAAESGSLEKMDALIEAFTAELRPGSDVIAFLRRQITHTGASIVHCACRSPSIAMIERCVGWYGGFSKVRQSGKHNGMLIKVAGRGTNPAVFEYVRERTQHLPVPADDDGWTPVHSAAAAGSSRMFRYLVDVAKHDVYAVDRDGYTVLHSAVVCDSPTLFDMVAERVNDEIRSRKYTEHGSLLSIAASRSNLPMLKHLIAKGYGKVSDSVIDRGRRSLLFVAARGSTPRVFKWILDHGGGTLDDLDETGRPLDDYAKYNSTGIMTEFIHKLRLEAKLPPSSTERRR